jgi:hypothetical protein
MFIPNLALLKDYSVNEPTIPAIGAAFAASGPYASFVLLGTVPADQGRQRLYIQNDSAAVVALVLDDGTTASGSVPAAGKASVVSLAAASAAGGQGGVFSNEFKGRVQIYGASGAQVTALAFA